MKQRPRISVLFLGRILIIFVSLFILNPKFATAQPDTISIQESLLYEKPILTHILLDSQNRADLQRRLNLSDELMMQLGKIVNIHNQQIEALEASSQKIVNDPLLDINQKQALIEASGYNDRLRQLLRDHLVQIKKLLTPENYPRLLSWITTQWKAEQKTHIENLLSGNIGLMKNIFTAKQYPRSFEIYATRYESGGRYVIALPDKCLKFANAQVMQCSDGYKYGKNYSVAISYKGKIVVAPVLEAGPWNIDDNYWSTTYDPQPRRMFTDLGLGIPEAQAAFYTGYNGGQDQFGRKVTSPVAIDISYEVDKDLGLPGGNSKVTVSFLWTEGWDNPVPGKNTEEPKSPPTEINLDKPPLIVWTTSTPNPDGSIVHIVQSGQTLIGISTVYEVSLDELLELNQLTKNSFIFPGDKILVRKALSTATPTFTVTPSPVPPSSTPSPTKLNNNPTVASPTSEQISPTFTEIVENTKKDSSFFLVVLATGGLLFLVILLWYVIPQKPK